MFELFSTIFILVLVFALFYSFWQNVIQAKTEKQAKEEFEEVFKDNKFTINKEIEIKTYSNNMENNFNISTKFVVDDENKKFGIISYNSTTKKTNFKCYEYSKLINFNLYEDGEQLIAGRGLAAAGGALIFGITGAIIGSVAGNKKIKNKCNELSIRIQVNDLQTPLLTIFLLTNCDKTGTTNSTYYTKAKQVADEIIATLTYIDANK